MHTACLETVCASVSVATTRYCSRGGVGPQIKFEQIFSDHHQMSLARGGPRSDVQGWREGVPYRVTYLMQWWMDLRGCEDVRPQGPNSFNFMQFWGKFGKSYVGTPPGGWSPHIREILDPPLPWCI